MRVRTLALATLGCTLAASAQVIPTRDNDPALQRMAGCLRDGKQFMCSKSDLRRALALSHTVRLEVAPPNHASQAALTDLAHRLGKQIVTPDQPADLILTLAPMDGLGVVVGPAQMAPLARLRVLIADHSGGPDKLLWVEDETGDPSRPWPLIARATTTQFEHTVDAH